MSVLYRDYRPKNFSEVINQENIKTTLQKAVSSGAFAHAYLFTGPRGTGKTSVARILARAINCLNQPKNKDGQPCNECEICQQFLNGSSLDLIEIDAASNTGVENIRDITEHLKFSPTNAKYKVFIIDEVHMLSKGAFNALLKTLEEPPAHAVFILATTEVHKVPATVISRTQRFDFKKIDNTQLAAHLANVAKKEKIKIDAESLNLIVNASEGSVRDALSILDKLSTFDSIDLAQAEQLLGITNIAAAQTFLDLLAAKDAKGTLDYLQKLFAGGADPVQFNKDFLEYMRKVLMVSMGAEVNYSMDQSQKDSLNKHAQGIEPAKLLHIIRLFLRANKDFSISPSLELPMQIAAAESCLGAAAMAAGNSAGSAVNAVSSNHQAPSAAPTKTSDPFVPKSSLDPAQPLSRQPSTLTIEKVTLAWPAIMQSVKQQASSIFAVLKSTELKSVDGNVIRLTCRYKFHKDALESARNSHILLEIFEKALGENCALSAEVLAAAEAPENQTTDSAVLEVFGTELV